MGLQPLKNILFISCMSYHACAAFFMLPREAIRFGVVVIEDYTVQSADNLDKTAQFISSAELVDALNSDLLLTSRLTNMTLAGIYVIEAAEESADGDDDNWWVDTAKGRVTIAAICLGGVVVMGAVVAAIVNLIKPTDNVKRWVYKHRAKSD